MSNRWTPAQEQAIKLHNRNLLVSAAAGSGKTAVLVERIVQMITGDHAVDVDRLLVLTFTRAAAGEMRERVGRRISQMLAEDPDNQDLKRQSALLPHAMITTIDSFCLRVVRDYFGQLDLDPDFRIGETGELKLLQADCMEELLEKWYEEADPDFLDFAEGYGGGKSDRDLAAYIEKVFTFAQSCPYPEDWLRDAARYLHAETAEDVENQPQVVYLKQYYQQLFKEIEAQACRLLAICREADGPAVYESMMMDDLDLIRPFLDASGMAELCSLAANLKFGRKPGKKSKLPEDPAKRAAVSNGRDELKSRMTKIADTLKTFDLDDMLEIAQGLEKPMKVLLALAEDYGRIYLERKQEKNIVDFSDIEHYALSILVDKQGDGNGPVRREAALQLRDQYAEILVDEYQDSNYLQEMILTAISGEQDGQPNMFMVGDIKQSIYRFRMARPEIFMGKYRTYSSEDSLYQKIDLQKNFRSRGDVLEGINRIFYRIMTESLGDVEYDDAAALYKGADYPPRAGAAGVQEAGAAGDEQDDPKNALKLVVVDVSKEAIADYVDQNTDDLDEDVESTAAEAYAAAREIRRIVDPVYGEKVYDRDLGQNRPASYKDVVILLRSTTKRADKYLEILTAEGIPASAAAMGYFSAMEVRTMLSFLQIIDNPLQDIPLATVMKSVIGGFSSEELAQIETSYREALRVQAEAEARSQAQAAESAALAEAAQAAALSMQDYDEWAADQPELTSMTEESEEPFRTGAFYDALFYVSHLSEGEAGEASGEVSGGAPGQSSGVTGKGLVKAAGEASGEVPGEAVQAGLGPAGLELARKCRAFLDMLNHYRYESDHREVYELIQIIYRETGYYDYVSAMPAGSVRRMNLDMLVQKAVDYENTSYHGLFHFVRYMQHLEKYEVDFEQGQAFGEQDDIVRIYSIHKSKGLEYPIVILGGMAKYFNMMDSRARIMLHPDLGVAADYVDTELRCRMSSIAAKAVSQRITADAMGEELRILYVAMTRAKEKLIMIGADRSLQKHIDLYGTMENHGEKLPLFRLISANSYLDWIMMAAGDQLDHWMEVEFLTPGAVFVASAVREAGKLELVDQLRRKPDLRCIWDGEAFEKLGRMDSLVYTHQESVEIQSKFSVSELKHEAADRALAALGEDVSEPLPEFSQLHTVPRFMRLSDADSAETDLNQEQNTDLDTDQSTGQDADQSTGQDTGLNADMNMGALYGTYHHRAMELINPALIRKESDVVAELSHLEACGIINLEYLNILDTEKIFRFYVSDLGQRFTRAYTNECLYREQPFILSLPARVIRPEIWTSDEPVLIQGIMDAWFIEDDEIVLIDYKTDGKVTEEILRARYQRQFDLYRTALEMITGKRVKEMYIWSFYLGRTVEIR